MAFKRCFAVFPGQGSQHVEMGKDLYREFQVAREVFEEASDAIRKDLKKLCFVGPESDLTLTENTQPALLTTSIAAFRVAQSEYGFSPNAVAGHSLGEYSALVAAQAISLTDAVKWVCERGKAMQLAVPAGKGAMAAILGIEDREIANLCGIATSRALQKNRASELEPIVEPANFNAPCQVVVAGTADAVEEAVALVKEGTPFRGKAVVLPVSAPFHCRLMAPARRRMEAIFSTVRGDSSVLSPLRFPYVPNRTARLTPETGLIFDLLAEQVDHPVLWNQSVAALLNSEFESAVEFGPGKVLCGLIKRISQGIGKSCTLASVPDSDGIRGLESFMKEGKI